MGLKVGIGSTLNGFKVVFDNMNEKVNPRWACVENFMELSWWEPNIYLDLWKYFHGVEDRLWKYSPGFRILIGSHQNGWREVNWSHRSYIVALKLFQEAPLRSLEVLSWVSNLALEVLSRGWRFVRPWKYSKGLKIIFGSHQNSWKKVNWSHRSFIRALTLFQETLFRPLEVLSWGWK